MINKTLTVVFDNGETVVKKDASLKLYEQVIELEDEKSIRELLFPEYAKKLEEVEIKKKLFDDFKDSEYLEVYGQAVYIKSISELTVPEDLAVALYKAEKDGNEDLIQTYLNFWTLCSLNPDSRARTNMFWFLNKYEMTISKSGLIIAYRNVKIKKEGKDIDLNTAKIITDFYSKVRFKWKKSPKNYFIYKDEESNEYALIQDGKDVDANYEEVGNLASLYENLSNDKENDVTTFTDAYTGNFNIKIGEPVRMDRNSCDSVQENSCSRG